MKVIEELVEVAAADAELLRKLDGQGDRFGLEREVEFLLRAPSAVKATTVASFINDYRYGVATPQGLDSEPRVLVVISMPIEQHIIASVSGFMVCISQLFGLEYDGWGCVVQAVHS